MFVARVRLPARLRRVCLRFVLGVIAAVGLFALTAEGFLRLFPPRDLHPYLGEESPLTGLLQPDPEFGVAYQSWDAFHEDYAERLKLYEPFQGNADRRPIWGMFGNSFVHAPGMLADTARARVSDHVVFNLGRNEPFPLRFAQVKLLLDHGLEPERIFFSLLPIDLLTIGKHPLSTVHVTERGAITYEPRPQLPAVGWLADHSRLGLAALVRTSQHGGNPRFKYRKLCQEIDPTLLDDLKVLFGNLARVTQAKGVPVTILLLPNHEQVTRGERFGFQDTLAPIFRGMGFDVLDPRDAFLSQQDRDRLFIPDKHFSDAGNAVLLAQLLAHVEGLKKGKDVVLDGRKP